MPKYIQGIITGKTISAENRKSCRYKSVIAGSEIYIIIELSTLGVCAGSIPVLRNTIPSIRHTINKIKLAIIRFIFLKNNYANICSAPRITINSFYSP